jgi:kanamycin kinase
MKRTEISVNITDFPTPFAHLLQGARIYDSSCSPEARVWFVDEDGGYFLKRAGTGTLEKEAAQTRYFHTLGLSAAVLDYRTENGFDWLLTARVAGEDCTHADYLSEPARLCDLIATRLRALHELSHADCPVQAHTANYIKTVEENHRNGVFDPAFLPPVMGDMSKNEAFSYVEAHKHLLKTNTLLHGDYCLPNILLNDWEFSGFIDLGNGGVGDRHVDLFWGAWTLGFNLGTDAYRDRFFDAYGRDKIDLDLIALVGVAECFG